MYQAYNLLTYGKQEFGQAQEAGMVCWYNTNMAMEYNKFFKNMAEEADINKILKYVQIKEERVHICLDV